MTRERTIQLLIGQNISEITRMQASLSVMERYGTRTMVRSGRGPFVDDTETSKLRLRSNIAELKKLNVAIQAGHFG